MELGENTSLRRVSTQNHLNPQIRPLTALAVRRCLRFWGKHSVLPLRLCLHNIQYSLYSKLHAQSASMLRVGDPSTRGGRREVLLVRVFSVHGVSGQQCG